jgi:hypothetical protein
MTEDYHESELALQRDFRKKMKMSIFDRVMKSMNISLSVPLLHLKPRRDAFVGQGTKIFLCGLIISRSF